MTGAEHALLLLALSLGFRSLAYHQEDDWVGRFVSCVDRIVAFALFVGSWLYVLSVIS